MKDNSLDAKNTPISGSGETTKDQEILNRLKKLKEDSKKTTASEEEIANRLLKIKGDIPKTTDAELQERLARLRGVPVSAVQSKVS